ncbi:hypothetical protein GGS20DRAFT_567675 [Poronia punctata]|nr:hypothetical protein GGS20DRAFT_567675 [Poronia punctata]
MSAFAAINVEPEDNLDEEVDISRELLIDEALKRFQAALKLHSHGPKYYEEARAAYVDLFQSEIFRLPESVTDFERTEKQAQAPDLTAQLTFPSALDVAQPDIDSAASSLPQTLYLAYKNHGQFVLDGIRHKAKTHAGDDSALLRDERVLDQARKALDEFSTSLDHDPSDAELWRRAARVAAFLSSARINRYCLEAAIELDDDPAVEEVDPPSLAEGFAGEQLKAQLQVLYDQVALAHPAMAPFVKKTMPAPLQKFVDPLPFLPDPTKSLAPNIPRSKKELDTQQCTIHGPAPSWSSLGLALLAYATHTGVGASRVVIEMADIPDVIEDVQMLIVGPKERDGGEQEQLKEQLPGAKSPPKMKSDETLSPEETLVDTEMALGDSVQEKKDLGSRKRSQSAAGLPDGADDEAVDQKRSKRTRRRDTTAEGLDSNTLMATLLQPFQAADKNLFQMTRNFAENLGVEDKDTLGRLGEIIELCALDNRTTKLSRRSMVDLRDSLTKFVDENAKILLAKKTPSPVGLNAFLEHSKPGSQQQGSRPAFHETKGLAAFVRKVNDGWMDLGEVIFLWIQHVCARYLDSTWSDELKTTVVQTITYLHEDLYRRIQYELSCCSRADHASPRKEATDQLVQVLCELHLDIYERITNPNSAVDLPTRMGTKVKLDRWYALAAQLSRERPEKEDNSLTMRFLWSSVFAVTLIEGAEREHVLQCWKSLRDRLSEEEPTVNILLPNNAVMPEVSAFAADREISKLTTMDFFLGLFNADLKNPLPIIESLEPVLNPSSVVIAMDQEQEQDQAYEPNVAGAGNGSDSDELGSAASLSIVKHRPISETASQGLRDLWKFLLGTSTELRLSLWSRLGAAYEEIGYKTKQFSCHLKSIEMIVDDFERDAYLSAPDETRLPLFMKMLKFLDDLLISALSAALNESTAFDIVDEEHLRCSIAALAKLCCLLHVPSIYEDEVRVGMMQHASNSATFQSLLNKLREMQARNWSLMYTLFKTGINQNKTIFPTPESDRAEYLAAIHQVLGLRKFCKSSNKIFLRMMRIELLKQNIIDNWEDYLGQVLYDLYGLKLGVGLCEVQDHGCPPEKLERRNTMSLVARISVLAHRMPMKDLLKSDLKNTIDQMQQAIGQTKSNQQLIQNLRIFNQAMAKPIHPLRLYEAFKGNVAIDAVGVNTADSTLAKHRWFFLLGMIAFTKFKGVDLNRRQTPGATDDLRIGATFLRQQLQFTPDQWDAWFRLAECFDYELDESVLWTADKMNKERGDLVKYQRNAIHCYTLALSHSRSVIIGDNEEASDTIHDLFHKFGMRMYASSREPFAMEPFQHSEHKRFIIHESGTDTKDVHSQMSEYKVWKYAARLFKKAMEVKPKEWRNPYMYAKCIWKMYMTPSGSLDHNDQTHQPTVESVIDALEHSVKIVSALPKPRHGQDPILEPHYKIVSVVHKLVILGDMDPQEAADVLQRQPYAIDDGGHVEIPELEDWEPYIIRTLTHLREKDRANWQHRIFMRHARILFDEHSEESNIVDAMAAFSVLKEAMLTKTMVMNVWKCDAERPGRHHVYTEQYVRFVVKLLVVLKDRTNFEAMLRRLRKKGADYYHFTDLWQTCCLAYLRLIRQAYQIPPLLEDEFKLTTAEEFDIITKRINEWCADPASSHPALRALQEVIELKKLNGGLMKVGAIDDLINDCYTALYYSVGKSLPGPDVAELLGEKEQDRVQTEPQQVDKDKDKEKDKDSTDTKHLNPFSGILNPQSHENSGTEGPPGESAVSTVDGTRPRKAGIRRADVLRKAEQVVLRMQEGTRPTNGKSRGSVSSGKTPAADENDNGERESDEETERGEADGDADGDVDMKDDEPDRESSSEPGSVHDSADDESDLSDVPPEDLLDEQEAERLMFPGLRGRSQEEEHESSGDETQATSSSTEAG